MENVLLDELEMNLSPGGDEDGGNNGNNGNDGNDGNDDPG